MISFEIFLIGLLITSTLTGLATEAVKRIFDEFNIKYYANTLSGIVALVLSAAIGVGFVLSNGGEFTGAIIAQLVALVFMSWLCAMVGYDKVIQVISQFKTTGKD